MVKTKGRTIADPAFISNSWLLTYRKESPRDYLYNIMHSAPAIKVNILEQNDFNIKGVCKYRAYKPLLY